ncbi:MAG: hypothetical protein LBV09_06480 [Deferribacteraceae bacterium]|jgi:hypothetical protein|nr:hypothetical protein [Deferribacteraceae bacterium]
MSEMMKPSDTIVMRGNCYSYGDFAELYELYASESDFRAFFVDASMYEEHAVYFQSKESKFVALEIIDERIDGDTAEVNFIEEFEDLTTTPSHPVKYTTKCTLVLEDEVWKILSEEREER